jgi:hypothetical protein
MFVLLLIIAPALLFFAFLGHMLHIGLRSRHFELHPEAVPRRSGAEGEGTRWARTQSMVWSTRQE